MGMGQAAGTAAALALAKDCNSRTVPIAELQDHLIAANAILDPTSAMEDVPFAKMPKEADADHWK